MNPSRPTWLLAATLLLAGWLGAAPSLRAANEPEMQAQAYERVAGFMREASALAMQKAEDTPGDVSSVLTSLADTFRTLADTKVKIAAKIREGTNADDLRKADEEQSRKLQQLRDQLHGMGVSLMERPGEGRPMHRAATEMREAGGFRPRKTGAVVLNTTDDLRNWLDEEEARAGSAK